MNRAERLTVYLGRLDRGVPIDPIVSEILAIADSRVLLNTTQAAERYELAPSTLYRWSRADPEPGDTKPTPALWVGKIPLWDQDELDAYAVEHLGRRG